LAKLNWERDKHKRIPPARRRQRALAFKARHPGWCANCGAEVSVGTPLRYNADDQAVHANGCPPKKDPPS
jgi:hypothetical protein